MQEKNQRNKIKYAMWVISGVLLVGLYYTINPALVQFFPKCPLYATTGVYCPGCGSQRATHYLLHLDFVNVIKQNVLFVLGLLLLGYAICVTIINYFFKKNYYNYLLHPKTPVVLLLVVLIFWVLRNINFYPFYLLAPH